MEPLSIFAGQLGAPQVSLYAMGFVTSTGGIGSFVLPVSMANSTSISKTATGVYKIIHGIPYANRYLTVANAYGTTSIVATIANASANSVEVRTFTSSTGVAVDAAFSFAIFAF